MIATASDRRTARPRSTGDRVVAALLLVALALACVAFWVGVPVAGMWAISKLTDEPATHFVTALIAVPTLMVLFAPILFWVNNLYLRVTGVLALMEEDERMGWKRRIGGPLEPMLFVSFLAALVALSIWFFFFAENPPHQVI